MILWAQNEVGPSEDDDKDHDFLRRDDWRKEAQFRNVEFRRALLRQLQKGQDDGSLLKLPQMNALSGRQLI